MHADDIMKYGHDSLMGSLEGLPESNRLQPGACGEWSVKDIMAHMAACEVLLVDVLKSISGEGPTPALDSFVADRAGFNDGEVARRASQSWSDTLGEYSAAYEEASTRLAQLSPEDRRRTGALEWYGAEYDLEDFIVYTFYGHKREHGAQISAFRDR